MEYVDLYETGHTAADFDYWGIQRLSIIEQHSLFLLGVHLPSDIPDISQYL